MAGLVSRVCPGGDQIRHSGQSGGTVDRQHTCCTFAVYYIHWWFENFSMTTSTSCHATRTPGIVIACCIFSYAIMRILSKSHN